MSKEEKHKKERKNIGWLLKWMGALTICFILFITLAMYTSGSGKDEAPLIGNLNEDLLTKNYIAIFLGTFVLCLVAYPLILFGWITKKRINKLTPFFLTLIPVALLGMYISTSGGLLNSPFSLATGAYLTSVFLHTEDAPVKGWRVLYLLAFVSILVYPYLYLWFVHELFDAFIWKSDPLITTMRIIATLALVIITGAFSHKASKETKEATSLE